MVKEAMKIWTAGLFDGEGHAAVSSVTPRDSVFDNYKLNVSVTITDEHTIDVLEENWVSDTPPLFGPASYRHFVPGKNTSEKHMCGHILHFGHFDAFNLLLSIFPYLITKREDAEITLRAISAVRDKSMWVAACDVLRPFYLEHVALKLRRKKLSDERDASPRGPFKVTTAFTVVQRTGRKNGRRSNNELVKTATASLRTAGPKRRDEYRKPSKKETPYFQQLRDRLVASPS